MDGGRLIYRGTAGSGLSGATSKVLMTLLSTADRPPDAEGLAETRIWDRFLRRTGLVDSCAALDCPQPGRIDKIAFRGNDRVTITPTRHRFVASDFRAPGGEDLSDHEPLEVVFRWNAT